MADEAAVISEAMRALARRKNASLTPEQRSESARKAAVARWGRRRKRKPRR